MIKSNIFLSALGLLAILILPIYPNSGTLDFGGNVDASIVYLLTLFITCLLYTSPSPRDRG